MILYHFTARRYVQRILRDGITLGAVLTNEDPIRLDYGYRWLTVNPSWDQEWAEGTGRLPYKRNETRLTVEIPDHMRGRLLTWQTSGPILSRAYRLLSAYGDPQNWRLYQGDIPPDWIRGLAYNPDLIPTGAATCDGGAPC